MMGAAGSRCQRPEPSSTRLPVDSFLLEVKRVQPEIPVEPAQAAIGARKRTNASPRSSTMSFPLLLLGEHRGLLQGFL
jgi:hypothetical protein